MAVYDIYSKRQKRLRGEVTDIYQYDSITDKFKVQFMHIINDTIGECPTHFNVEHNNFQKTLPYQYYGEVCRILRAEYGVFSLQHNSKSFKEELFNYLSATNDADKCLDVIELLSRCVISIAKDDKYNFDYDVSETIKEINVRFRENGIGYQFENTEIIRVDSQFIHAEVVKPVLILLSSAVEYSGALDEFLSAHEHYRHDNFKECLNDCLKSFESLMKAIHDKNNWQYGKTDTASKLINSCLEKQLVPPYLQGQFTSLKTMLETGIPTIRNKISGHGQGTVITNVPRELVSYMLHLTATNLLYLAQCDVALSSTK